MVSSRTQNISIQTVLNIYLALVLSHRGSCGFYLGRTKNP